MTQSFAFTDSFGKYRFIYKITYPVTGQFYIGKHQTSDLNDGYMGSGTSIQELYQKIGGSSACIKQILIFTDSASELNQLERVYIKEGKEDNLCINRAAGGDGGWDYVNSPNYWTPQKRSKSQRKRFKDPEQRRLISEKTKRGMQNMSDEVRTAMIKNQSDASKKFRAEHPGFYDTHGFGKGSHHTQETKERIAKANSGGVNFGKVARINKDTGEKQYFSKDEKIPGEFIPQSQYYDFIGKISNTKKRKQKRHKQFVAKRKAYIKETQEMADYFTKYGYEATCRKFPDRSGTCSIEAMLMRFIKARKRYGIRFESLRTIGQRRKFETLPESQV